MASPDAESSVVLFANSLWNIANFRMPLIRRLREVGYGVIVAAPDTPVSHPAIADFGDRETIPVKSDVIDPVADARMTADVIRMLRRRQPVAMLSFTPKANIFGGIAARFAGVPFVPNVSGLGTAFLGGWLLRSAVSLLYRVAFRQAPVVFFQNPDDRDLFVRRGLVRDAQARLLPGSGVDCERFRPMSPPHASANARHVSFLFVGRLLAQKGLRELVEAMRIVKHTRPQARLTLLGPIGAANRSAIAREEIDGWVAEGLVDHAGEALDVRPYIAAADAVVLPSWREGLPRSLLEAAAMAKPLIASDVPGCREIVRDGENGYLHEVKSAEAIAAALLRFIDDSADSRTTMGLASRRRAVAEFGEDRVIEAYVDVVRQIVPRSSPVHVPIGRAA